MYGDELKKLLRPLFIYDLSEGPGADELNTVGQALDGMYNALDAALADAIPLTAGGDGLSRWESLMPEQPPLFTQDADRRSALCALLRIDDLCFTKAALEEALRCVCAEVTVSEAGSQPHVAAVTLGDGMRIGQLAALRDRIEALMPCHLTMILAVEP